MSGLSDRLLVEPDYRPYCLACSTMQRMALIKRGDLRVMRCEIAAETHPGARVLLERFGIPPRVGCGLEFDVDTGQRLGGGGQP